MATTELIAAPVLRVYDNSGNLAVSGLVYTYVAGTSTPIATYTDSTGVTPNTNPIILNSRGECSIWVLPNQAYKLVAYDASNNLLWSKDNIQATVSGVGSNNTVSSIAALRGVDKTKYSQTTVTGYYLAGDGGGGSYYYDSSDTTSSDNGGTVIVATDGGRWKLLVNDGIISVEQFGAKADGVTDASTAINAALTACAGIVVYIPPGTYYVNSPISIPASTTLRGAGVNKSILLHGTSVTSANFILLNGQYAVCDKITVNGNYTNVTSFTFAEIATNADNCTIENCYVYNLRNMGLSGGTNYAKITKNIVSGISSSTIGSYGIWAIANNAVNQEISENIITGTYIDAIGASGIGLKVFGNYISGCQCNTSVGGGQLAIYPGAAHTTFADVYDNYIAAGGASVSSGIELNGWCSVHDNIVTDQKAAGIVLQAGTNNYVDHNVVKNTHGPGIVVDAALNNFAIRNNTCFDDQGVKTQTYGIQIQAFASQFFEVTGNILYGNLTAGLIDSCTGNPTKKVCDNAGYTVGQSLSVGASPYTYTNTRGEAVVLLIYSGVVSSVVANGRLAATATNTQVIVIPGTTAVVTYSSLPGIDEYGLTY